MTLSDRKLGGWVFPAIITGGKKKLTAEEIKVLLEMRAAGVKYTAIAQRLGLSVGGLTKVYQLTRATELRDSDTHDDLIAQLPLDDLETISSLREQRVPWSSIASRYPGHELSQIRRSYKRFVGSALPPADLREVQCLRQEGKSWKYIVDTDEYPYSAVTSMKQAYH
jgi:hypothetical protein